MAGLWVRVRDTRTGHEYDVTEQASRHLADGVEKVDKDAAPRAGEPKAPTYKPKPAASAPAKSANKADWVAYAVTQGMDPAEAEAATKDALIEAHGNDSQEG